MKYLKLCLFSLFAIFLINFSSAYVGLNTPIVGVQINLSGGHTVEFDLMSTSYENVSNVLMKIIPENFTNIDTNITSNDEVKLISITNQNYTLIPNESIKSHVVLFVNNSGRFQTAYLVSYQLIDNTTLIPTQGSIIGLNSVIQILATEDKNITTDNSNSIMNNIKVYILIFVIFIVVVIICFLIYYTRKRSIERRSIKKTNEKQ